MPHLYLKHSANIIEKNNLSDLFKKLHVLLAEKLPTKVESNRSIITQCDNYYIGDGSLNHAFVHLDIKVLSGRTPETLNSTGQHVMEILKNHFAESAKKYNVKFSLEIIELQKTFFQG